MYALQRAAQEFIQGKDSNVLQGWSSSKQQFTLFPDKFHWKRFLEEVQARKAFLAGLAAFSGSLGKSQLWVVCNTWFFGVLVHFAYTYAAGRQDLALPVLWTP